MRLSWIKKLLFALCILLLAVGVVVAADNNTDIESAVDDTSSVASVNDSVVSDGDEAGDLVIDAAEGSFNDNVPEVSYKFRVVNASTGAGVNGASFSFASDPNSFSKSGYSDDYGYCHVSFPPSFITGGSALINVWYGGLSTYKVVNFKVNHIETKKVSSNAGVSGKLKVSAPTVKVTQGSNKYFKVTVKKGTVPVKSLRFKVKVWTGKKAKTYTVKTNKYGVAKLSVKKLKLGTHKVKVVSSNKKYKFSKVSKIKVVKKSNLKHFTLKLKHSIWTPDKKRIGKDIVVAWFETDYGRQSMPGVYVEANHIPDGRSLPKHIRLVKAKFYFSTYMGKDKVITVKAQYRGGISGGLYKDYTPYKVVVFYKKR